MTVLKRTTAALLGIMGMLAVGQAAPVTIPAGTTMTVRMADSLDSSMNHAGETFRAIVDAPVTVNGRVVIPVGAEAIGRLNYVEQPGRFRGRAVMAMELTALNFDGKSVAVLTSTHQEAGGSRGRQTATYTGGGGALGTLFGAMAGGSPGFLIGAAIGAAGGAVVQAVRGPDPVRIPAESLLLFTLQSPITLDTPSDTPGF